MFICRGCEALKAENERLHKLVDRLIDKVAGPVLPEENPTDLTPPPPFEIERDDTGRIVAEHHRYGGE